MLAILVLKSTPKTSTGKWKELFSFSYLIINADVEWIIRSWPTKIHVLGPVFRRLFQAQVDQF